MNKKILLVLLIILSISSVSFKFFSENRSPSSLNSNSINDQIDLASLLNKTKSESINGHKIQIQIQNGCGERGVAKLFTNFLRDYGYDVLDYKNASNFNYSNTEIIIHKKDSSNFEAEMIDLLKINPSSVKYNYNKNIIYEMTVIIGDDYNTLDSYNELTLHYGPF
tara:strand:- start:118 stop:615 length:498 start_codon:yes stop_codon:yes gene_type:complete